MKQLTVFLCIFIFTFNSNSQEKPTELSPIIFIYDASGSMWGQMQGKTKMEIAANVLSTSIDKLPENQNIGFVAYGHRKKGNCKDVEFLVDVENGTKSSVHQAIKNIKPLGKTPLAYSALLVIDKLRQAKLKATIILVTDGIESCGGNICDVIKAAKKEGVNFKLHIIGFGLKDGETDQLKCAAKESGGNYYDAKDADGLSDVLEEATSVTIDDPKGNVSVYTVKNGIAIDAYIKAYDVIGKRKPINVRTYQDTAYFYLPPSKYNLEVNPLEGTDVNIITVEGIQSFEGKMVHKTISFDGGKIGITTTNNDKNWDCVIKVFNKNGKVAATTRMYLEPKEIEVNPGIYKITIQALASMKGLETYIEIENVKVEAGGLQPISHNFSSGTVFINAKVDGSSIDSLVTIKDFSSGKSVAGGRTYDRGKEFLLNPGAYKVSVAPLGNYKDKKAQTFTLEIQKNDKITKTLNF